MVISNTVDVHWQNPVLPVTLKIMYLKLIIINPINLCLTGTVTPPHTFNTKSEGKYMYQLLLEWAVT